MENCFYKAMEMAGILDRMGELCQKKAKTININEKDKLDKQIEILDLQYHEIKHKLMKIPYSTAK